MNLCKQFKLITYKILIKYKNIKIGLYQCLERMVPDSSERCKIDLQLDSFKDANGLFGIEAAKITRDKKNSN